MKKILLLLLVVFSFTTLITSAQERQQKEKPKFDKRIDNMSYWRRMAEKGYVPVAPKRRSKPAVYKGSQLSVQSVLTEDSIDVPVTNTGEDSQSEVSIFVDPTNNAHALNSNNSVEWSGGTAGTLYGTDFLSTEDYGATWGGSIEGAGGANNGDPAAVISLTGRQYIGFIHSNTGQGVSYSDDGITWTSVVAGNSAGGWSDMLDKNHLWIDNAPSSPFQGYLYDAWTNFGGSDDSRISIVRSIDNGLSYSTPIQISSAAGGSLNQGVNLQTGPNGEVYAVWSIYDSSTLNTSAYGFAKSVDGGASFSPAVRIIDNVKGIRDTGVLKDHRVNSFPSMAVDISGGTYNGNIYMVWANTGVPGTNTGTNKSVYMIKSTDGGTTWSSPIKVNQGVFADGKEAYFSWITCDPVTGTLSVIFYDDRNTASTDVEVFVANSFDGGDSWEDFRVSDVSFTPAPIAGLAGEYMGDYLGISARDGMVYPAWPDNRNGYVQTFVSAFETNLRIKPTNLNIVLTEETGQTDLTWDFEGAATFDYFVVYRDDVEITTTTNQFYTDMLPAYGVYTYKVTAMHTDGESSAARTSIQWGNPNISVTPMELIESLNPDQNSTKSLTVTNTGELELTYSINSEIASTLAPLDVMSYCEASGGSDEYISGVVFGDINNTGTAASGYADYTSMSTSVDAGGTYPITITNGNTWGVDDLGIWIDLNQDEDFDDEGENVLCLGNNGGEGTFDITIPDSAVAGVTRMRIRIKYSGDDCGSPCGAASYGEVEDYTLNINSWLHLGDYVGTLAPGTSETVNVYFDSTDLALGDYYATLHVESNATDLPLVDVPVTLHVTDDLDLNATATADSYEVCQGSETLIYANAVGGEGTYTYSWSSVPVGFTSTEATPVVLPTVDTVYTVEVSDGVDTVSSEVAITVTDISQQPDAPTGEDVELCQNSDNTSYTVSEVDLADAYIWILTPSEAGEIIGDSNSVEINWNADFNGDVELSVQSQNSCGTSDASDVLSILINPMSEVSFDYDTELCFNADPIVLEGGLPEGGTYSGPGVEDGVFYPVGSGSGTHTIVYSYTNDLGCTGYATSEFVVNSVPAVSLEDFADIGHADAPIELTGGSPAGGVYSGAGVSDGYFDPTVAGIGISEITYTYTVESTGCQNSAISSIEVLNNISVNDVLNGVAFNIYPNPSKGLLSIDVDSSDSRDLQVVLINQVGSIVLNKTIAVQNNSHTSLDLNEFSSGVYFIRISDDTLNYTRRIIIQK